MHPTMWIENALNFVVNWFTFTKNGFLLFYCKDGKRGAVSWLSSNAVEVKQSTDFSSFLLWRWKRWGCQLTFIERCESQADLSFTWCLQISVVLLTVRWFLEDFPLSFIFNTADFVHSAYTSASVVSGATRLDSMHSCPGRYSPLQSILMFGAEFVPRSVVLSHVCTTL